MADEPAEPTDAVIDLAVNCFALGVAVGGLACALVAQWQLTAFMMLAVAVVMLRNLWKLTRHWWIHG